MASGRRRHAALCGSTFAEHCQALRLLLLSCSQAVAAHSNADVIGRPEQQLIGLCSRAPLLATSLQSCPRPYHHFISAVFYAPHPAATFPPAACCPLPASSTCLSPLGP